MYKNTFMSQNYSNKFKVSEKGKGKANFTKNKLQSITQEREVHRRWRYQWIFLTVLETIHWRWQQYVEMTVLIKYNIGTTNLLTSTNLVMTVGMNGYMW